MSALNSPIELGTLIQSAQNVLYPDDPNAAWNVDNFFYLAGNPATGVFSDFRPRIDGGSAADLDKILRLIFRTNKFHVKARFHGIETTESNGTYTDGPSIPYTWEDDLTYQSGSAGDSEGSGYQYACSEQGFGVQRRNSTPTPGSAFIGPADGSTDQLSSLTFYLYSNGAATDGSYPLFLSFLLQCYPVAPNPYGGTTGAMYVESAGDNTTGGYAGFTPNAITLAGQTFGACSLGCAVFPPSPSSDGTSKIQNMSFDSLEITETGSWSWDGLYD